MRTELKSIGSEERHTYSGTFERKGIRNGWKRTEATVLLTDIRNEEGNLITDHLWFNDTKGFQAASLQPGDRVEFQARVTAYQKGYQGHDLTAALLHPVQTDYHLSRPTRIRNLTHPEAMKLETAEERKRKKESLSFPPSPQTQQQIEEMTAAFGISSIRFTTEADARKWINNHLKDYRNRPSQAQKDFIEAIADELSLISPFPLIRTKKQASEWISQHMADFRKARRSRWMKEKKEAEMRSGKSAV